MKCKYFIINILSVICLSLIITNFKPFIINTFNENISEYTLDDIRPTSVWCRGSNHTQRRCRFVNLCYKKDTEDYLFLNDDINSIRSGIPFDRFSPALLDMSSVVNHNQFYFNYIEIPFNVLAKNLSKKYRIIGLRGKTFIMSRFKTDNLMHYFHDDLIPLYFTLQEIGSKEVDRIFLDDVFSQPLHKPFPQNRFETVFPKSVSKNDLNEKSIYCFEQSFIGLSKSMVWYDYGFRSPQSPISRSKDQSLLIAQTIRKLSNDLFVWRKCTKNYVIFLSRKMNRKILNEKQLIDFISNFTTLSVIKIDVFNENFEQLIEKVFCCRLLIGIHGSALILSMFLRPGTSVIELFPFAINPDQLTPYKTLTQMNGMKMNYFYWKNQFLENTFTHREYPQHLGGVDHLSPDLRHDIMASTHDVPKHLCCSDPYWLYRIYQDTVVDINSFEPILDKALKKSLQAMVESDERSIAPGYVLSPKCQLNSAKNHITIVWQKPWNLDFIPHSDVNLKYEVLIQEVPSVSAKSSFVETNELSFVSKPNKIHNIWIRCKLNGIDGPFNTNALIC